jgi:selenide,water dikinase
MAVTGIVHPDRVIRNVGVQPGDALVLTKPLGTGIITTALKNRAAPAKSVRAAVASMVALNSTASRLMRKFNVHACSDVTGYGLLGHAFEMASGTRVTIALDSERLPVLDAAVRLAEAGCLTGGCKRNRAYLEDKVTIDPAVCKGLVEVAFDPQTSGGLLIALSRAEASGLVRNLRRSGNKEAGIVGYATSRRNARVRLI